MAKRPNWRRVKRNRSYTYAEAAQLLGVHERSVQNWVRRDGLPAITDKRPHLIVGADLADFLRNRNTTRKTRMRPHEMFCLRCRAPRIPAGNMVDCTLSDAPTGNLCGICPVCDGLMHKRVSLAQLDRISRNLEITIKQA